MEYKLPPTIWGLETLKVDGCRHCRLHNPESTQEKSAQPLRRNWTSLKPEKPRPESNTELEGYRVGGDIPEMTSLLRPLFCFSLQRAEKKTLG